MFFLPLFANEKCSQSFYSLIARPSFCSLIAHNFQDAIEEWKFHAENVYIHIVNTRANVCATVQIIKIKYPFLLSGRLLRG